MGMNFMVTRRSLILLSNGMEEAESMMETTTTIMTNIQNIATYVHQLHGVHVGHRDRTGQNLTNESDGP